MTRRIHLRRTWALSLSCASILCLGQRAQPVPPKPGQLSSAPAASAPPAGGRNNDVISSGSKVVSPSEGMVYRGAQTYVYAVDWRLFSAGTATIRIDPAGAEQRIVGAADGTGAVSLVYHVKDRLESFFDPRSFCSLSMTKHTEEGLRKKDINIRFDYARKKAVLDEMNLKTNEHKHEENDIPGCVTDVLSAIFYAGTLPLNIGESYSFPLNDGGKTADVTVRVEGKEEIKVPAGTFQTIRLQPQTAGGVLRNKGQLWLWYSNDGSHMPVQMRSKAFWGTLTMRLQRFERK